MSGCLAVGCRRGGAACRRGGRRRGPSRGARRFALCVLRPADHSGQGLDLAEDLCIVGAIERTQFRNVKIDVAAIDRAGRVNGRLGLPKPIPARRGGQQSRGHHDQNRHDDDHYLRGASATVAGFLALSRQFNCRFHRSTPRRGHDPRIQCKALARTPSRAGFNLFAHNPLSSIFRRTCHHNTVGRSGE